MKYAVTSVIGVISDSLPRQLIRLCLGISATSFTSCGCRVAAARAFAMSLTFFPVHSSILNDPTVLPLMSNNV